MKLERGQYFTRYSEGISSLGEQRARQGVRLPFARLGKARRRELPHRRLDVQRVEEAALRICLQGFAPVT